MLSTFSNQTKNYLSNEKIDFKFIGLIINLIIEFINSKKGALNLIDLENLLLKIMNLHLLLQLNHIHVIL